MKNSLFKFNIGSIYKKFLKYLRKDTYVKSHLRKFLIKIRLYRLVKIQILNFKKYTITVPWNNERAIEVPFVWKLLKENKGKNILEVGNVLSHYFSISHDIVDKYEISKGVINQDALDYHPFKKYDLIISISTLEHIGWDEIPRDPMKVIKVMENLKNLLTSNGIMVVTIPIGYNPNLDILLKKKIIQFSKKICFKKVSKKNKWQKINWNEIFNVKYNSPFPSANGLIIGIIINNIQ